MEDQQLVQKYVPAKDTRTNMEKLKGPIMNSGRQSMPDLINTIPDKTISSKQTSQKFDA